MKTDPDVQKRFALGMQFYRDAVEQERLKLKRVHPAAPDSELERRLAEWHLKPQEWVDPAFGLRRPS